MCQHHSFHSFLKQHCRFCHEVLHVVNAYCKLRVDWLAAICKIDTDPICTTMLHVGGHTATHSSRTFRNVVKWKNLCIHTCAYVMYMVCERGKKHKVLSGPTILSRECELFPRPVLTKPQVPSGTDEMSGWRRPRCRASRRTRAWGPDRGPPSSVLIRTLFVCRTNSFSTTKKPLSRDVFAGAFVRKVSILRKVMQGSRTQSVTFRLGTGHRDQRIWIQTAIEQTSQKIGKSKPTSTRSTGSGNIWSCYEC